MLAYDFDNLRSDIKSFKAVMQTAVGQAGDELNKEIEEVNNHIGELQEKLKKWGLTVRNY